MTGTAILRWSRRPPCPRLTVDREIGAQNWEIVRLGPHRDHPASRADDACGVEHLITNMRTHDDDSRSCTQDTLQRGTVLWLPAAMLVLLSLPVVAQHARVLGKLHILRRQGAAVAVGAEVLDGVDPEAGEVTKGRPMSGVPAPRGPSKRPRSPTVLPHDRSDPLGRRTRPC